MSAILKFERQQKILDSVKKNESMTVIDLATSFDVSEITIRRDLDEMVMAGLLERVHGGARLPIQFGSEPSVMQRRQQNIEEKRAIAAAAVSYVKDGDVIALESGSTTLAMANLLAQQGWGNLHVITNSFPILDLLIHIPSIKLIFIGGMVAHDEACTFGPFTEDNLKHLNINKMFMGCRGLDPRTGRTNEIQSSLEINTVKAFANASEQLFMLADHSKFGRVYPLQLLEVEQIDILLTSELTPKDTLQPYIEAGIEVVNVSLR